MQLEDFNCDSEEGLDFVRAEISDT